MNNPRELGKNLARAQDRLTDEAPVIERAERRLFDAPNASFTADVVRRRSRLPALFSTAAAVLVLVGGGIAAVTLISPPLTVTINGRRAEITESLSVQSEKEAVTAIGFSDGSSIQLNANTRTRFIDIGDTGAEMLVERGSLVADIVHTGASQWRFFAGPFDVRVTGTRFALTWDHRRGFFSVEMAEGSVVVNGPMMAEPSAVAAGENLNAWVDEDRMEIALNDTVDTQNALPDIPGNPTARAIHSIKNPLETASSDGDMLSRETGAEVEKRETHRLRKKDEPHCPEITASLALSRADSERRDGRWTAAVSTYETIRRCCPNSKARSLAAFNLGKIAFDNRRDWIAAARWFEHYIEEQQGEGPVREALGRLMESYLKAHRLQVAREVAERYLAKYPTGPHAALATSVLEEDLNSIPAH